jgi:anti-sigma B factor antagonist
VKALGPFDAHITQGSRGSTVVSLAGELDIATAPEAAAALRRAAQGTDTTEIIIDLADLRFLDATGIRVLLDAHRLSTALCRLLRARNVYGEVDMVLRLTGIADLLDLPCVPQDSLTDTVTRQRRSW